MHSSIKREHTFKKYCKYINGRKKLEQFHVEYENMTLTSMVDIIEWDKYMGKQYK